MTSASDNQGTNKKKTQKKIKKTQKIFSKITRFREIRYNGELQKYIFYSPTTTESCQKMFLKNPPLWRVLKDFHYCGGLQRELSKNIFQKIQNCGKSPRNIQNII